MALPARPQCVIQIPGAVFVGEPVTMHVKLTASRETKVDYIDVRVRGRQGWHTGSGSTATSYRVDLPTLEKRVMSDGVLTPGTHEFPLQFTLPRGTAPSHTIAPAYARLLIDVRVSIPWWLDGKYSFVAPVRQPPPENIERTPVVTRQPFTAKPGEPRLELSLASTTLAAGETLLGSAAVFHMPDGKARDLDISLEPMVKMLGLSRPIGTSGRGYGVRLSLPPGSAGQSVPIRIGLPADMTPSFKSATHEITWSLKAKVGSLLTGKLSLNLGLVIVDARAREKLAPLTLTPRVADERVVAAFERFAAAHRMTVMREEDDRYPDEQPALVRELGDATIRIGYAYRGERGTFLVGRVSYPSLGLGLSVTPSSGLRELFTRDIEIDIAAWDRAHRVDAREAAQVVPFLRSALPTAATGSLLRWTDDEIVTERSIGAIEEDELASLVGALDLLATTIMDAQRSLVPPSGLTIDLAAWHELATRYSGRLVVGDLSIRGGKLDMQPVEIGLVFDDDDRPRAMRVGVGAPQGGAEHEPSDRVRELLATVAHDLPDVTLVDGVASASIPLETGTDVTRVRDVARTLRAIVAALYESAGPYR